jgi:hypothetical protein
MKRAVMIALSVASLMVLTTPVQAARRTSRQQTVRSNDGFFARLMELERRKNAALRQMFSRR